MSITSITLPEKVADQRDDFPDSQAGQWVPETDYWQTYYHDPDFTYKWNNGILEVKPMPDYLNFEEQAKQEQERAEAAEQRAERYAAKLKELGLLLD